MPQDSVDKLLNEEIDHMTVDTQKKGRKRNKSVASDTEPESTTMDSNASKSTITNFLKEELGFSLENDSIINTTGVNDGMEDKNSSIESNKTKRSVRRSLLSSIEPEVQDKPRRSGRIANQPNTSVEIVSAKIPQFKQRKRASFGIENRLVTILPMGERPSSTMSPFHVEPTVHDYERWNFITSQIFCASGNLDLMRQAVESEILSPPQGMTIKSIYNYRLDWDNEDTLAYSLWPRDGPHSQKFIFPVMTTAAGDCLPSSVSRLMFGTEHYTREIRTRMTIEGILYEQWYLKHQNLAIKMPELVTDHSLPEKYALFSGSNTNNVTKCYENELKRCFLDGQYCGMWQIHHLSTVIGRPIIVVFPEFEDVEDEAPLRFYHNRTIYPRDPLMHGKDPVTIMWTKASEDSPDIANHFVPVVM